jgi:hypothetical protein
MRFSTLLIFVLVSTCCYHTIGETTLEKGKDTVKEKVQEGADLVKEKAEAAKDSVKEGAESVKDSVKETVQGWSDKAHGLWEKSGLKLREASQAVRNGIKFITPEFLRTPEPDPMSKLQEWKTKAGDSALKELTDAATLLEEANNQVKDILTLGQADAKAKMTRLRVGVDHAVRHATRAFQSMRTQASREGFPQALSDNLQQGWVATGNAVESLKDLVSNAYSQAEDRHEIVSDLEATFKQWDKFKALAGEKLVAAKEAAMDAAHTAKDSVVDGAQTVKDAAGEKLQAAKDAAGEKLQAAKDTIKQEL